MVPHVAARGARVGAHFQLRQALLAGVQAAEGFAAFDFQVDVEFVQAGGDGVHGLGEADDGFAAFGVSFGDAAHSHRCHTDAGSGDGGEDFEHDGDLYGPV